VNTHKNARLTFARRWELARRAQRRDANISALSREFGVSRPTVHKWRTRYATEGEAGLRDRSSKPHRCPQRMPRHRRHQIARCRRDRWSSLRIAQCYGIPLSTVVTEQRRLGLARLRTLAPPRPVIRYERRRPGTLVHLDIKKLGKIARVGHRIHGDRRTRVRGIGWEYVHVAIDDCTRYSYAEVLPNETGPVTAAFVERAVEHFALQRIRVRRILTDNGPAYLGRHVQAVLKRARIRHLRTRPYRPQTNGKAERLIRTLLHEWAYAQAYSRSAHRTAALPKYLRYYNTERRHTALKFLTPAARLTALL
jgi:transposase InsO family protein/transposase